MKIFNSFLRSFNRYATHLGRARARDVLLKSSDRMLEDAGFSRELLESGVKAWPWHKPAPALIPMDFKEVGNVAAMRELQNDNGKELHDLGISRGAIPESMMSGRDGIDNDNKRKVA